MGENNADEKDQTTDETVENKDTDTTDESQEDGGADDTQGDDSSDDDKGTDDGDEGENGDEDAEDDKKSDADKSKKQTNPKADEEPETRKRKTNVDFILERKNRKIEKLQKDKDGEADQGGKKADKNMEAVDARIQDHLKPFVEKQMREEDEAEISSFIAENPDFKGYADKVRKFAQHPTRKDVPITSIFYEVAGKDLMKIGADRAKKAGDESKKTQAGGGSNRGTGGEQSVWDLTPEEFQKKQEEIRNKPRE